MPFEKKDLKEGYQGGMVPNVSLIYFNLCKDKQKKIDKNSEFRIPKRKKNIFINKNNYLWN